MGRASNQRRQRQWIAKRRGCNRSRDRAAASSEKFIASLRMATIGVGATAVTPGLVRTPGAGCPAGSHGNEPAGSAGARSALRSAALSAGVLCPCAPRRRVSGSVCRASAPVGLECLSSAGGAAAALSAGVRTCCRRRPSCDRRLIGGSSRVSAGCGGIPRVTAASFSRRRAVSPRAKTTYLCPGRRRRMTLPA